MKAERFDMAGTWDLLASSDSKYAVWAEDDWDEGIEHCLSRLEIDSDPVLDLGCGMGRLTFPIAEAHRDWQVWGLDVSAVMIEEALRDYSVTPCLHLVVGDGESLPADWTDLFSTVFSVLMFQHVPDEVMRGYLREVRRVLREDGRFVFQFAEGDEQAPMSYQRSRAQVARWLAQAGFKMVGTSGDSRFPTWCWVEAC